MIARTRSASHLDFHELNVDAKHRSAEVFKMHMSSKVPFSRGRKRNSFGIDTPEVDRKGRSAMRENESRG